MSREGDVPNDLAVDGARDAVLELEVHLGDGVLGEDGGIRDITCGGLISRRIPTSQTGCDGREEGWWYSFGNAIVRRDRRTDGSGLDHVADGESLDGLVLGNASRAVGAADGLDVAAALLVATAVQTKSARPRARIWDQTNIVLGCSLLDHVDVCCVDESPLTGEKSQGRGVGFEIQYWKCALKCAARAWRRSAFVRLFLGISLQLSQQHIRPNIQPFICSGNC